MDCIQIVYTILLLSELIDFFRTLSKLNKMNGVEDEMWAVKTGVSRDVRKAEIAEKGKKWKKDNSISRADRTFVASRTFALTLYTSTSEKEKWG